MKRPCSILLALFLALQPLAGQVSAAGRVAGSAGDGRAVAGDEGLVMEEQRGVWLATVAPAQEKLKQSTK